METEIVETKTYAGRISIINYEDVGMSNVVRLSTLEKPLAELLMDDIDGKFVSVRNWICDKKVTKVEAQFIIAFQMLGAADVACNAVYNEITGFLWADNYCNIGGHDLLAEISSYEGKWLILEIDIMKEKTV